jgi:hypothetical protein
VAFRTLGTYNEDGLEGKWGGKKPKEVWRRKQKKRRSPRGMKEGEVREEMVDEGKIYGRTTCTGCSTY